MRAKLSLLRSFSAGKSFARYLACSVGATAIEFAFVAPIIIGMMLAAVQISAIYIAQAYLESVTEKAMRIVLTNQSYNLTAADFRTQLCANINALFDCNSLIIDLRPITCNVPANQIAACLNSNQPTFDASGAQTTPATFNSGAAGDKMRLLVMYQWPVISGPFLTGGPVGSIFADYANGTRQLSAVEIFYKEPCLDASNCVANNG